jgi:predicted amidohydrolase
MPGKGTVGLHICYDLWFPETSRALALAGAELIINPTLTPTKDREIETLMVRTTAAQQQAYYIDVNSCGDQGCGLSIAADPDGNVLHKSSDQEDLFTIDVDFDVSHNSRIKGFMGLGQNLKSYRDRSFNELGSISKNQDYLDNLGDLKDFNKENQ